MAEEEKKDTEDVAQPKKSKLKLIIIASLVVIFSAGGFFGWQWYSKSNENAEAAEKEKPESIIMPLKSFIVNLVDKKGDGKRYLKVAMELEVGGAEQQMMVEKNIPRLRDSILLQLSSRTLGEINTMEGKLELKQVLLAGMNRILGEGIVQRVYFTEFVIQ